MVHLLGGRKSFAYELLDAALPVAVYEPSTRDTPVKTFTAQTFTQSVGGGMEILQIG